MAAVPAPTGKNDTPTLVAWFAAQPPGTVCDFPADAHYTLDDSFLLDVVSGLTIHGHNATLEWTTKGYRARAHVLMQRCTDVTIDGLNIIGANPSPGYYGLGADGMESQHAFAIRSCRNITIDNCTATKPYADFVYLSWHDVIYGWTDGVTISNCTFTQNGRQAVAVISARNVTFDNCTFDDIRRSMFDFEPNGPLGGAEHILVKNCTVGRHRLTTVASLGYPGNVHFIEFRDNLFTYKLTGEIHTNEIRRGPFIFRGNVCKNSGASNGGEPGAALAFYDIDGVYLHDNSIIVDPNRYMVGVAMYGCTDIQQSNNVFPGARAHYLIDGQVGNWGAHAQDAWYKMPRAEFDAWHADYKDRNNYPRQGRNAATGELVDVGYTTDYTKPVDVGPGDTRFMVMSPSDVPDGAIPSDPV